MYQIVFGRIGPDHSFRTQRPAIKSFPATSDYNAKSQLQQPTQPSPFQSHILATPQGSAFGAGDSRTTLLTGLYTFHSRVQIGMIKGNFFFDQHFFEKFSYGKVNEKWKCGELFFDQHFFRKIFLWKSQWKMKISIFRKNRSPGEDLQ